MNNEINAKKRDERGTGASRRLRRAGFCPAVVYGGLSEPMALVLEHNSIYHALKQEAFHSGILHLLIDGAKQAVMLRDVQMHPYKQQVLHLDFQRINMDEPIHMRVQLHFINAELSIAVKQQGAKISHILTEVDVRALPGKVPPFIEVDLSAIEVGSAVHLSDLKVPEGVEITSLVRGDNSTVALAMVPRGMTEAEGSVTDKPAEPPTQ